MMFVANEDTECADRSNAAGQCTMYVVLLFQK